MDSLTHDVKAMLKQRALKRGAPFKLSSGEISDVYVDCRRVTLHGPSLKKIGALFWEKLKLQNSQPSRIAGVSIGGDPLVAAVILAAADEGVEIDGLLVRKEPKSHGASQGKCVEGVNSDPKASVWLLEDVVTSGGSIERAVAALRQEGHVLGGVMTLVSRNPKLPMFEEKIGVGVMPLFRMDEIL